MIASTRARSRVVSSTCPYSSKNASLVSGGRSAPHEEQVDARIADTHIAPVDDAAQACSVDQNVADMEIAVREHVRRARTEPFRGGEDPFCGVPTRRLETHEDVEPLSCLLHAERHVGAPVRIDRQCTFGIDSRSCRRCVQRAEEPPDLGTKTTALGVRESCIGQLDAS